MAKPKNQPKILNIQSHIGPRSDIAGKTISINLKNTSMFGIGDIKLTPQQYWATISHGMDANYYEVIQKALSMGNIVLGKKYIAPIDKDPKVLEKYWSVVRANGRGKQTVELFKKLVKTKIDSNYSLSEITSHCIDQEKANRNRKDVISFLEEALSYADSNDLAIPKPYDDEEGKVDVMVDITQGVAIPKNLPPPPKDHVPGNLPKNKVLDDLLNA
jgi:hypothetical protein